MRQLQSIWHSEIPITAAMGIEIVAFEADELRVAAQLEPNVNVHGTAFAGSLYSVCALTGWGMCWLKLRQRSLSAAIVLASAQIDYRLAVRERIVCRCRWHDAGTRQLDALETAGRTRVELECDVTVDGASAVGFSGDFALRRN